MKIIVTGSLGNISRRLAEELVKKGHEVIVITHDQDKQAAIRSLGAVPVVGSLEDEKFLKAAFAGADAVYTMIPPSYSLDDMASFMRKLGKNYAEAITGSGIRYVVNLSGIGAHLPAGMGPSSNFHCVEQQLNSIADVNVLHLRAGMFYTNLYGSLGLISQQGIMGSNYSPDAVIALVHPHDIADAAAEAFNSLDFSGKQVRYIVSEEKTGPETAIVLAEAFEKPLQWVQFSDMQLREAFVNNGFSQHMAGQFEEMGKAIDSGRIWEHYQYFKPDLAGKRSFKEFAEKELAPVYKAL